MRTLEIILRVYLFAGLAAHKVIWEFMKRGRTPASESAKVPKPNLAVRVVKMGKVGVTLGLFVQLFLPEFFRISSDPLALKVSGLIVFTFGLMIAILARVELGNNWSDIEVAEVKGDHMLVNGGVYRYVRHPIYAGDLAMLLGFELCLNCWLAAAVVIIAIPTINRAVREEQVLAKTVSGYETYRSQTKRFIPFVI